MANVSLFKQDGTKNGDVELNADIFGIEPNNDVVFEAVVMQRASMRQGTHAVKNRSAVRGGGRKPWRQKGTGRARQGTIRAPQWRGGGIVFAPTPRTYKLKVNKKVVRLAMRCALSSKVRENSFIALDQLVLESYKTKGLVQVLANVNASGKVLVITKEENGNVELAGRNIANVLVQPASRVSVYQMMNATCVVMTQDAVAYYEEVLK